MKRYRHGLVLGKFYPPHAGHHHLVRTAQDRCERLTVLVCAASVESIPLADRVAWMREVHPDVRVVGAVDDIPVDLHDPAVWDAHMAVFRAAVPEPVDAVFTSEPYGDELARRFGAEHVCVDPDRTRLPGLRHRRPQGPGRLLGLPGAARTGRAHPPGRRARRRVHRHHHHGPGARRALPAARRRLGADAAGCPSTAGSSARRSWPRCAPSGPDASWEDVEFTSDGVPA